MLKNQATAALRRTTLLVFQDDGVTPIARNTNFATKLFIDKGDANYVAAAGTLTNKRLPLTGANFTYTVTIATDTQKLHAVAHGLQVIDGPFRATSTGVLPAGQALLTDYWVTPFGNDDFKISTSLANALLGAYVTMTGNGTGVQTWNFQASTQRGVDGDFQYEFTQAETNQTANFLTIFVPGVTGTNAPARSIVDLAADSLGFDTISEAGYTYGDSIRGIVAALLGKSDGYNTNAPRWFGMDDATVRLTGTTTTDGRTAIVRTRLTP